VFGARKTGIEQDGYSAYRFRFQMPQRRPRCLAQSRGIEFLQTAGARQKQPLVESRRFKSANSAICR
jgi:hypothetical protein